MRTLFLLFSISFLATALSAQTVTKGILVGTGGSFNDPSDSSCVGLYDPADKTHNVFDCHPGASAQDLVVKGDTAYFASQFTIVAYDLKTKTRLAATDSLPGLRHLALKGDKLIVTRGFGSPEGGPYVMALDQATLDTAYTLPQVSDLAEGIAFHEDTCYVGVPGQFGSDSGHFALFEWQTGTFGREVTGLGEFGAGLNDMFTYQANLYAVADTGLLRWDLNSGELALIQIPDPNSPDNLELGKVVARRGSELTLTIDGNIGVMDLSDNSVLNSNLISGDFASALFDPHDFLYYVAESSFSDSAMVRSYSTSGFLQDSFKVGISPEAMALWDGEATALSDQRPELPVELFPNPSQGRLVVEGLQRATAYRLVDLQGRTVSSGQINRGQNRLDFSQQPKGFYLLQLHNEAGQSTRKIRIK